MLVWTLRVVVGAAHYSNLEFSVMILAFTGHDDTSNSETEKQMQKNIQSSPMDILTASKNSKSQWEKKVKKKHLGKHLLEDE